MGGPSTSTGVQGISLNFQSAHDVFLEFFGGEDPYANLFPRANILQNMSPKAPDLYKTTNSIYGFFQNPVKPDNKFQKHPRKFNFTRKAGLNKYKPLPPIRKVVEKLSSETDYEDQEIIETEGLKTTTVQKFTNNWPK